MGTHVLRARNAGVAHTPHRSTKSLTGRQNKLAVSFLTFIHQIGVSSGGEPATGVQAATCCDMQLVLLGKELSDQFTATAPKLALGGLGQVSHRGVASRQSGELVNILVQELVLDQLRSSGRQFVNHRPREEQRGRVSGDETGTLDGDHAAKPL